jgi:hypothetical protein
MTQGALIFAFDNEEIEYVRMAAWSAANIHRHLDLPVCLVTDAPSVPDVFDRVIKIDRAASEAKRQFDDIDRAVTWYNRDRIDAFDISPWDHTLVLDADYVVASDWLRRVPLSASRDFWCYQSSHDVSISKPGPHRLDCFGAYDMPMSWATVMCFRKSSLAHGIFTVMRMVRENWSHYRDIYGFGRSFYRNDFALSIALSVTEGHAPQNFCPDAAMINVLPDQKLSQLEKDQYQVSWRDTQGRDRYVLLQGIDFHAMCKGHLGAIVADHS